MHVACLYGCNVDIDGVTWWVDMSVRRCVDRIY